MTTIYLTKDTEDGPYVVLEPFLLSAHHEYAADFSPGEASAQSTMIAVAVKAVGGDWTRLKGFADLEPRKTEFGVEERFPQWPTGLLDVLDPRPTMALRLRTTRRLTAAQRNKVFDGGVLDLYTLKDDDEGN